MNLDLQEIELGMYLVFNSCVFFMDLSKTSILSKKVRTEIVLRKGQFTCQSAVYVQ